MANETPASTATTGDPLKTTIETLDLKFQGAINSVKAGESPEVTLKIMNDYNQTVRLLMAQDGGRKAITDWLTGLPDSQKQAALKIIEAGNDAAQKQRQLEYDITVKQSGVYEEAARKETAVHAAPVESATRFAGLAPMLVAISDLADNTGQTGDKVLGYFETRNKQVADRLNTAYSDIAITPGSTHKLEALRADAPNLIKPHDELIQQAAFTVNDLTPDMLSSLGKAAEGTVAQVTSSNLSSLPRSSSSHAAPGAVDVTVNNFNHVALVKEALMGMQMDGQISQEKYNAFVQRLPVVANADGSGETDKFSSVESSKLNTLAVKLLGDEGAQNLYNRIPAGVLPAPELTPH